MGERRLVFASMHKFERQEGLIAFNATEHVVVNFGFRRDLMLYEKEGRRFFVDIESGGGSASLKTVYINSVRQEQLAGPTVEKVDEVSRQNILTDICAAAETLRICCQIRR